MRYSKKIKIIGLLGYLVTGIKTVSETSSLNFIVSLKKSAINEIIEQEIPRNFAETGEVNFESQNEGKNNLIGLGIGILKAVRPNIPTTAQWSYDINRGPIFVGAINNNLTAGTDFSGKINGHFINSDKNINEDIAGKLGINSQFKINSNWQFQTTSTPFIDITKASLPVNFKIAGIDMKEEISVRRELERQLIPHLDKAAKKLDESIAAFKLRDYVEGQWNSFREPILLNKNLDLWIILRPTAASYGPVKEKIESFELTVGVDADMALYVGKPNYVPTQGLLPSVNQRELFDKFNIFLPITVKFESIAGFIEKYVKDRSFNLFPGGKINLYDIKSFGVKDKLNLKSQFNLKIFNYFNLPGKITAMGNLKLSQDKKIISIDEFDFIIESENALVKLIDKIFHETIKKSIIRNHLSIDVSKDIPEIENRVKQEIASIKISQNTILNTELINFDITDMNMDEQGITIYTAATGSSVMIIDKLSSK